MNITQFCATLLVGIGVLATSVFAEGSNPMVTLKTTMGDITLELYPDKAPITVENFLNYVDDEFYKGTIFHRVIRNFMIQGGGFNNKMVKQSTRAAIKNEAENGLKNSRGTIAMARTAVPDSATAQFFINTVDNRSLDFKNPSRRGIGYCVFGRVVEGMDVVDKIGAVSTGVRGGMRDVPQSDILIMDATRKDVLAETTAKSTAETTPETEAVAEPVEEMLLPVAAPAE